ncbi:MAG: head GIN domain-containing protein [Flavicella sp.]
MKKTIKGILLLLIITSCQFNQSFTIKGSEIVKSEERKIDKRFKNIEVSNGISLILSEGKDQRVIVEADENIHKHIFTEVSSGTLKIFTDVNTRNTKSKKVYVTTSKLESIYSNSGSNVISENRILADKIDLKTSSGSYMNINLETEQIEASTSSGSIMTLSGSTYTLNSKTSSGSQINAKELIAVRTNAKASSGSAIETLTTDYLNAEVSSGAHINSCGAPKEIHQEKSSGGMITFKKN